MALPCAKRGRVASEFADAHDLDAIGAVVVHQSPHFADRRRLHLAVAPLLALDQFGAAILAEDQVDAAVRSAKTGFLDRPTTAAEGFADQHFENSRHVMAARLSRPV